MDVDYIRVYRMFIFGLQEEGKDAVADHLQKIQMREISDVIHPICPLRIISPGESMFIAKSGKR